MKIPKRSHRSGVFIVNFEHNSHLFLVFPLLTLNKLTLAGKRYPACHMSVLYRFSFGYMSTEILEKFKN